jgi:hypothetical protein
LPADSFNVRSSRYESSRTFEKVHKTRGAGFSLPGRGVSPITSFTSLAAAGGEQKREKGFLGDTPNPGKGLPPSALPLEKHA